MARFPPRVEMRVSVSPGFRGHFLRCFSYIAGCSACPWGSGMRLFALPPPYGVCVLAVASLKNAAQIPIGGCIRAAGRGSAPMARQSSLLGASGASAVALAAPKSPSPPPPCASAGVPGVPGAPAPAAAAACKLRGCGLRPQTPQRLLCAPAAARQRRTRGACAPCRVQQPTRRKGLFCPSAASVR